jgi:hypothetical protein
MATRGRRVTMSGPQTTLPRKQAQHVHDYDIGINRVAKITRDHGMKAGGVVPLH